MNAQEIQAERKYRFEERIGMMTEGLREPTAEEIQQAQAESDKFTGE